MDAIYAGQRHVYDLTRKYYLPGRDRLIRDLAPPAGGHVIEIGCGTGRNLIAAARRWPEALFYGIDISEAMLATARANIARAGLGGRIALAAGDATRFDPEDLFGRATFDRAFLSYTLSMIPDWRGAIAQARAVLGTDGRLAIVDFGQQERLPRWWRRLLFAWLARFDVSPRDALLAMPHAVGARALYRGYAWRVDMPGA